MSEFNEALERIVAGPERKSRVISDAEKAIIAYHEGGHAVVQRILPKCDPVAKVTIISRGMALGYTMALPTEDRYLQQDRVRGQDRRACSAATSRSGSIFGDTTTGASNDIEKATDLARRMVTEFGMSDSLGPLSFGKRDELVFLGREIGEQRNYSDEVARTIDEEVRAIIDRAYERAMEVLTTHRDRLVRLAEKLVAEETVDAEEFEKLFSDLPPKATGLRPPPWSSVPGQPIPEPERPAGLTRPTDQNRRTARRASPGRLRPLLPFGGTAGHGSIDCTHRAGGGSWTRRPPTAAQSDQQADADEPVDPLVGEDVSSTASSPQDGRRRWSAGWPSTVATPAGTGSGSQGHTYCSIHCSAWPASRGRSTNRGRGSRRRRRRSTRPAMLSTPGWSRRPDRRKPAG